MKLQCLEILKYWIISKNFALQWLGQINGYCFQFKNTSRRLSTQQLTIDKHSFQPFLK